MNGILPLYKPKGFTSHDCVMKVRKILGIKKVGHTGTLDPNVEGVLPICIGEATKIIPFLSPLDKVYITDVCVGTSTTTEDSEGEVISREHVDPPLTNKQINEVIERFQGEITQVPPMYSAVKVKGKKLYEYARENKEVKRPVRTVTIHEIARLPNEQKTNNPFRISVRCSKGTYIRTLCVDIGKELGYPAHMSYLQRVESDSFVIEDTVTFSEIEKAVSNKNIAHLLHPLKRGLLHLDCFLVDEATKQKILHGQKLLRPKQQFTTDPFKVMYKDELLAIYKYHKINENEIKPVRVFNIHKM